MARPFDEADSHPTRVADAARALMVTALYPPDVGGSAALFEGVYSRFPGGRVVVLTDGPGSTAEERRGTTRIVRREIGTRRWGFVDFRALTHHLRVARYIRRLSIAQGGTVVHCGRAIPEGAAALFSRLAGGPRYLCWTHGEDLASAATSRELSWLTGAVHRGAHALIANSRNTADMLAARGVPRRKIHIVYPGVDVERFRPENDGSLIRRRLQAGSDMLLLTVGRLQRRKGHDLAIQAVSKLCAGGARVRYVIAGDGEERSRLQELAISLGVADRVTFAGEVTAEELPQFYAACDLFVMPNRIDQGDLEGFGIVFLEAAASGRATVGGATGGVPEAVEHGETGVLVSGTDVDELAGAISTLMSDVQLRRRMGMQGRARVVERFTWDRAAAAVSRLHAELAE